MDKITVIKQPALAEWKANADSRMKKIFGAVPRWDKLTEGDIQWITEREKCSAERYKEQKKSL